MKIIDKLDKSGRVYTIKNFTNRGGVLCLSINSTTWVSPESVHNIMLHDDDYPMAGDIVLVNDNGKVCKRIVHSVNTTHRDGSLAGWCSVNISVWDSDKNVRAVPWGDWILV